MRPTVVAATEVEVRVATEVRVAVEARAAVEVRVAREVEMAAMDFQWIGVVAPWTGATNGLWLLLRSNSHELSRKPKLKAESPEEGCCERAGVKGAAQLASSVHVPGTSVRR